MSASAEGGTSGSNSDYEDCVALMKKVGGAISSCDQLKNTSPTPTQTVSISFDNYNNTNEDGTVGNVLYLESSQLIKGALTILDHKPYDSDPDDDTKWWSEDNNNQIMNCPIELADGGELINEGNFKGCKTEKEAAEDKDDTCPSTLARYRRQITTCNGLKMNDGDKIKVQFGLDVQAVTGEKITGEQIYTIQ